MLSRRSLTPVLINKRFVDRSGFTELRRPLRNVPKSVIIQIVCVPFLLLMVVNSAFGLGVGNRIKAAAAGANVRDATLTTIFFTQDGGTHGTITAGPVFGTAGGFTGNWWRINWDSQPPNQGSTQGWSAESVISLAPSAGDVPQPSFSSSHYTTANIFWLSGFAPSSTNPPNPKLGSALGNCTWYAHGRLRQLGYNTTQLNALTGDAKLWDNQATANGIPWDSTPAVGSIAQSDTANHVAIVESVNADGTITVTESSFITGVNSSSNTFNILWRHRTVSPSWFQRFIHVLADTTPPTVNFSVTPNSVTLGASFNISYTVSDTGGSRLKQVELWRANDNNGTPTGWIQLKTTLHSSNGPVSNSFSDAPASLGNYWYGIHVVDNAGNLTVEPNPPGPKQVAVTTPPNPNVSLAFPLAGLNPYTAPISAVLDHSSVPGGRFYSGSRDSAVTAYTSERGVVPCGATLPQGFCNPNSNNFVVNGNYVGVNADGAEKLRVLNYEGHSGYDYPSAEGTAFVPAASGKVYLPRTDPINANNGTNSPWCGFQTFYIDHGGGWTTWYLHSQRLADSFQRNIPGTFCSTVPTQDLLLGDAVLGQTVAFVGKTGTFSPHLHFEVRRCDLQSGRVVLDTCKVVDPYGWEGNTGDPIAQNMRATVQRDPLWAVTKPKISEISLASSVGGFTAAIIGEEFVTGASIKLADRQGQFFTPLAVTPSSVTSTEIVASLPVSNPEQYVLTVENPSGPRSDAKVLPSPLLPSSSPSFLPLALLGYPAPGGGTFDSFSTFYGMNNRGELVFNATVDTNGDGLSDKAGSFRLSSGQFSNVTVPGIGDAGAVRINNVGDMALGHAPAIGVTHAIYLLKSGSSTPMKIAEEGQPTPIPGTTFRDLRGPLAVSDNGEVTFSAGVFDSKTDTVLCCYLFLYSDSLGTVVKVVGTGDPAPIGGTFEIRGPIHNQITSDGDVVFNITVKGAAVSHGIFRFSRTAGISKVILPGDPVPQPVGGTIGSLQMSSHSVFQRKFVFQADFIQGGTAQQAILIKDDLTTPFSRIVAYQGQPTGTEVGGAFDLTDHHPFSQNVDTPHIRADGGVLFIGFYSHDGGQSTGRGVFLWTGKEFKKVAVNGDRLPSGQTLNGVSAYVMNDTGHVVYFVAAVK